MSGYSNRNLHLQPSRQNRESHINLGLISNSIDPDAKEPSRIQANQLQSIEESTASYNNSAQPVSSDGEEDHVDRAGQSFSTDRTASVGIGGGLTTIQHTSPWKTYERGYRLKFDQFVTIAARKAPRRGKVAIKEFSKQNASGKLNMIRRISHERFIPLLEVFEFDQTVYAVFEHVLTSLKQVVASAPFPTERQLAAILGQILEGLSYLSSTGLQHDSLCCSNVLLKPDGEIKIASQECCHLSDNSSSSDVKAVGYIAMELMQKYAKEDGAIGVDNLNRWPADCESVKFLSMTTSAASVEELRKHALFKCSWRKEDLELLEELASFTVHRAYRYPA